MPVHGERPPVVRGDGRNLAGDASDVVSWSVTVTFYRCAASERDAFDCAINILRGKRVWRGLYSFQPRCRHDRGMKPRGCYQASLGTCCNGKEHAGAVTGQHNWAPCPAWWCALLDCVAPLSGTVVRERVRLGSNSSAWDRRAS